MAKIKCKLLLKENNSIIIDNEYFLGIKTNNKISYKENNILVTILVLDNKIVMKRVSDEYEITLEFQDQTNTQGKYFANSCNLLLPLNIFTDKILVSDQEIIINYQIKDSQEPTNFYFKISYEVIG